MKEWPVGGMLYKLFDKITTEVAQLYYRTPYMRYM